MAHWFARYISLEEGAVHKASYESELVPDLLQTPCYTEAIVAAARSAGPSDSPENITALQAARQQRLLNPHNPLHLTAVLNEAVIRRPVGGREVMRAQLAYLLKMATERDNITLHILPFSAGAHPAMTGAFSLLQFCEGTTNTVYLEHADGAVYVDRAEDIRRYESTFGQLVRLALNEEETIAMIDPSAYQCHRRDGG